MATDLIKTTLTRRDLAALAGAAAISLVQGCGTGSGGAAEKGRGALTVTIHWPTGRAIPAETQSIKLSVQVLEPDEGLVVAEKVVARPSGATLSQAVLDRVPSVKVRVRATAHRAADGTGDILSAGAAEVRVTENGNVPVAITLGAIARIEIRPASISVDVNQSIQLSAHALDGQGNEVTVAPTSWQWSIAPGTIASIVPNGAAAQVTGLVKGSAIASVVLPEAGLSASKNVTVGQPGAGTLPLYLQAKPDGHGVLHIETSLGFTAQSNSATHSFDVTNRPGRVLVSIRGKDNDSDGSLGVGSIPLLNVTETGFDTSTDDRTATGPGTVSYDPALGGTMSLTMTFTRTDSEPFRQVFTYTTKLLPLGQ